MRDFIFLRIYLGAMTVNFGLVSGGFGLAAAAAAATAAAAETLVGEESFQKAMFNNVLSTLERSKSRDRLCLGCCWSCFLNTHTLSLVLGMCDFQKLVLANGALKHRI